MENEKYRNMTISLKVAAEEKIMLKRLAEKNNVTLSEFLYNIVMCFKDLYAFIGRLTPREEKLAENLRLEKKKNAKLSVQIENADFRVEMEMNHRIQIQNENHELIYQLKEEKAINANQAQLIIEKDKIIESLQKEVKSLSKSKRDQHMKYTAVGVLGLFTGGILSKN